MYKFMHVNNDMIHKKFKKIKTQFNSYEIIPREWQIKKIECIFKFLITGTNPRVDLDNDSDIKYIHYGDIHVKWNTVLDCDISNIPRINQNKIKKIDFLKEGDLIMADVSEDYEGMGASILLKNVKGRKIVSGLHTFALRNIDDEVSNEFITYLTSFSFVKKQIIKYTTGTSVYGISKNNFKKIEILCMSLTEQQKIASILSRVDASIESIQSIIERTEILKKGLMQKLLTKGIGHTKFKKIPWLFDKEIEIPEEWQCIKLSEKCIGKAKYGANISAKAKNSKLPRYIRITDLNDDGSLRDLEWKSVLEEDVKDYLLNDDDVLFARTGATVGKTYIHQKNNGKCAFAGYLVRFKPDNEHLNSKFLFYLTHSKPYWIWLLSIQTWGVQPNVNAEQYSNMPILLPTIKEQQKIASILSEVDAYIQSNQQYKEKLIKLKKGLMQKLLTGQIRVKL